MKPIKILLLFCAMLIGAVGVKAQVTALTAPGSPGTVSIPVTGTICPGTDITATFVAGNVTQTGCAAVQPYLQLVSGGGTVLAEVTSATVTLGAPGAGTLTLTVPAAAGGTSNNFLRYLTKDTGCNFTGTGTSAPGITVSPLVPAPTGVTNFTSVCQTVASVPLTLSPSGSCPSGATPLIYLNNTTLGGGVATQPSNTNVAATTYQFYIGCSFPGGCETLPAQRVSSTFTVNPSPAGVAGALAFGNGCVNVLPTLTTNPCPSGQTAVLYKGAAGGTSLLTAADVATPGTLLVFVGCDNGTCKTEFGQAPAATGGSAPGNTYTVNAIPVLTGALIQTGSPTSIPSASATDVANICLLDIVGGTTVVNFDGTCSAGNRTVWASATATTPLTGTVFAPTTAGTTDYYLSCVFGNCEGPRVKVSLVVDAAGPIPSATANFASVCRTTASFPLTLTPTGTCPAGYNLRMFADNTTPGAGAASQGSNSNVAAGTYNFYLGCVPTTVNGKCPTAPGDRVLVTFLVRPLVAGVAGALTAGNGCVNILPTITSNPCASGETAFLMKGAAGGSSLLTAADVVTPGTLDLYVGCDNGTCKTEFGLGVAVTGGSGTGNTYSVNAIPVLTGALIQTSSPTSTPGVGSATSEAKICAAAVVVGTTAVNFDGTCSAGTRTVWATATATTPLTGTVFASNTVGTTDYYLSCVFGTCEGPRTKVSLVVEGNGPTATGVANFASFCATVASNPITLTPTGTCPAGYNLRMYNNNTTVGGGVASQGSNTNVAAGTYNFYIGCEPTIGSACPTAPADRVLATFLVRPLVAGVAGALTASNGCVNILPALTSNPCPSGQTAFLMKGTAGGSSLLTAADVVTPGTLDLYVGCDNGTCKTEFGEGVAVTGGSGTGNTYSVNAIPVLSGAIIQTSTPTSSPVVPTDVATICLASVQAGTTTVNFGGTCTAGDRTIWASATATAPITGAIFAPSTVGSTDYYLSCVLGTCEGARTKVTLVVAADGPAPTAVANFAPVCASVASNPITLTPTGTCPSGFTLEIFNNNTTVGGGVATQGANTNVAAGTYNFYLGCTPTGAGCPTAPGARVLATFLVRPLVVGVSGALTASNGCVNVLPTLASNPCASGQTAFLMKGTAGGSSLLTAADVATPGTLDLYVGCDNGTCKTELGEGVAVTGGSGTGNTYTVNAIPVLSGAIIQTSSPTSTPTVPTDVATVCLASVVPGTTTVNFGGTCTTGDRTVWATATATSPITGAVLAPSTVGTTDYYLSCVYGTCEGARTKVSLVIAADGPAPTGVTNFADVCNTTASVALTLSPSGTCPTGFALRIYTNNTTVGAGVATQGSNSNVAPGTYNFYIGCVPTGAGCPTAPSARVLSTFTVNPQPATASLVKSTPTGDPVCAGTITLSAANCAATDSVKIWETTASGTIISLVKGAKGTDTSVDIFKTPSSATTYYFSARCITDKGCMTASATTLSFGVNATIKTPVASISPSSGCEADGSVPMFFNTDCGALTTVWYSQATGGTPIASLPNMTPSTPGTTTYYAACLDLAGALQCESPIRARVDYVVYSKGSTPTAVSLTADGITVNAGQTKSVCDIAGSAITFTGCSTGETILYSVDGANYTATVPTQIVDGNAHNYRIRCQAGSGASACTGPESGIMTLTVFVQPTTAPTASVVPSVVCSASPAAPFGGSSNCGVLATVWFDATTNAQLLSLPSSTSAFAPGTYSYYAKCLGAGGCLSPASAVTTLTVINNTTAPTITSIGGDEVCTGVNVTLTTNCPSGSSVVWSTGATGNALPLVANQPQVRAVTAKCVTTVGSTSCESPLSATKVIIWKAFDLTVINIGSSQSGVKPGAGVPKSAWAANFVTVDAGPSLQSSSQSNPSVYFTENPNKVGPRFWTIHVEACALPTTGSISYDMLATPETGVPVSFNTVENNAPYLMYANRDGFTELYAQNNPFFGFWADNGSGGNKYDTGLPKGLYKLSIRYWDQKGLGAAPATRIPQGNQLAYQEYWFRIQSQNGIGTGAAREGVGETTETEFAIATPNPVTRTLTVSINGAKGQEVKLNLVDAAGRTIKTSTVTPETNTHREEVDMTSQNTGMYFMQVSSPTKRASLKVLKVSQD